MLFLFLDTQLHFYNHNRISRYTNIVHCAKNNHYAKLFYFCPNFVSA